MDLSGKEYSYMKKQLWIRALAFSLAAASAAGYGMYVQPAGGITSVVAKETKADAQTGMQSVQKFGYHLMEQYIVEKNPVLSPVSAYIMLSMAGNGAKGATKKEFEKVLGSDLLSVSRELTRALPQKKDGVKLTVASSAWLDDQFAPKKAWLDAAKNQFQADVFEEDLSTEAAKDRLNRWVSDRTGNRIPKLLHKKMDARTRLALVNALYFQADWQQQFLPEGTFEENFKLDNGKTKKAELMHHRNYKCGYLKDDTSEGVVLPYKDSSFAFVAIRPLKEESIRDWYASYSAKKLTALLNGRETKDVELALPKFEIRCKKKLNESLKQLGLRQAFDEKKANLTLLGTSKDDGNLFLSFVLQESVIRVAEEGTEAAAATIGGISAGSALMPDKPSVRFDRSFLYLIMDMDAGTPLFMGIVDEP